MDLRTILIQLVICTALVSAVFVAGCGSATSTPPPAVPVSQLVTTPPTLTASSPALSDNQTQPATVPTTPASPPIQTSSIPLSLLILKSEPAGATVFVDNQVKGITPLTLDYLPAGDHTVVFMLDGYQNRTSSVTLNYNVKTIDIELQPNVKLTTTATTSATTTATTSATTSVTTSATTSTTTTVTTAATTSASSSQPVTIAQVSPTYIHLAPSGSASTQTISITGTGLSTPAGMKLTGLNTFTATTYTAASDSSATGEFSLPAGTTGSYSVVLTDSAGTTLATSTASVSIASY
ncbi:MAG TPA: PEGA domain-containing protein [Methanoregula sp.]|nr:PEGA domain-containing protein [Methanoregula sp.]